MGEHADGSIIIDTKLDNKGLEKGSEELLRAIKSLTDEVKKLGEIMEKVLERPIQPEIDTTVTDKRITDLESKINELEKEIKELNDTKISVGNSDSSTSDRNIEDLKSKIKELESEIERVNNTKISVESSPQTFTMPSTTKNTSALQREVDSVCKNVEKIEPAFEKAQSGSEKAILSFTDKMKTQDNAITKARQNLEEFGNTRFETDVYKEASAEADKLGKKYDSLLNKKEKLESRSRRTKGQKAAWQNLNTEIAEAEEMWKRAEQIKKQLEKSGRSHFLGSDTEQYQVMSEQLEGAVSNMRGMVSEAQRLTTETKRAAAALRELNALENGGNLSKSQRLGAALTRNFKKLGSVIKSGAVGAVKGLVSGIKSASKGMVQLITHGKGLKGAFSSVTRGAKKFALSMLGARAVYALLRKAVSAYMDSNQELSNTLSSCWTSIGNLLGPIITKIVNLVASAVSYITSFLKLFGAFGNSASNSMEKAGGTAKKETDKLKRQLASFDELNILSDNKSDSSGSGKEAAPPLADVEIPDWAKLMAEQIKNGEWEAAAKTLTDHLNQLVDSADWEGAGEKLAKGIDGALRFLSTAVTGFDWKNLGKKLASFLNKVITGVDWGNLGTLFGGLIGGVVMTAAGFLENLDWAALAKGFSDFAIKFFNGISNALKAVDWQQLGRNVVVFLSNIDWSGITSALFDGIGAAIGGLAGFLWGIISQAWESVVSWWYDTAYEDGEFTMKGLLNGIVEAIKNIGKWIVDNIFTPFINGFKEAFGIHSPSTVMAEQGHFLIEGLLNGITEKWNNITTFFSEKLEAIKTKVSEAWADVKAKTSEKWGEIKSTIGGTWENVKSKTTEACSSVYNTAKTKFSEIHNTITEKTNNIKSTVSKGFNEAKNSITSKMQEAYNTVKNQKWFEIGDNICKGIGNGINSSWQWLKNKVSSLANSLLKQAKETLGIHSPSRVFRDVIGLNMGLGVGVGLEKSQPSILKSIANVTGAIAKKFNDGTYAIKPISVTADGTIPRGLNDFADVITDGFSRLIDRLQSIAENVTFTMPTVAMGTVVPYKVTSAYQGGNTAEFKTALDVANEELISVIIQSFTNQTAALVEAIERAIERARNSDGSIDKSRLADELVREINRKTRMTGKSPLLF